MHTIYSTSKRQTEYDQAFTCIWWSEKIRCCHYIYAYRQQDWQQKSTGYITGMLYFL